CRTLDVLPPPLWGRVGEGGDAVTPLRRYWRQTRATPTPNPSPQGGGECTEFAALLSFPRIARRKKRVNALMLGTHNYRRWNMGPRFRGDDMGETDCDETP